MNKKKKTCGPMYLEASLKYAGEDPHLLRAFTAGFISGQAEKVYLGACSAAMFRPSEEHWDMVVSIATDVCQRYELEFAYSKELGEFWICRDESAVRDVNVMMSCRQDSHTAHLMRGQLCGVPKNEIDPKFHERRGYKERCDP